MLEKLKKQKKIKYNKSMIDTMYESLSNIQKLHLLLNQDKCKSCAYRPIRFDDYFNNTFICIFSAKNYSNVFVIMRKYKLNPEVLNYSRSKCCLIDNLIEKIEKEYSK